jgi:SAM-dependent methyltransferase
MAQLQLPDVSAFEKVPAAEFRALAVRPAEEVEFYGYDNVLLRETFWRRLVVLDRLLCRHVGERSICLDLGSGSGAYLPTLARRFTRVVAADRNTADAARMVAARSLGNVTLIERDVFAIPFASGEFDAIVAADVLEHFPDTGPIADRLLDWLKPGGVLLTSLPTESWLYVLLRKVFGVQKPDDHYFSGREVESTLADAGFEPLERRFVPLGVSWLSLFLVTAWRKREL